MNYVKYLVFCIYARANISAVVNHLFASCLSENMATPLLSRMNEIYQKIGFELYSVKNMETARPLARSNRILADHFLDVNTVL